MSYYQDNRTAALTQLFPELEFDETKFVNLWSMPIYYYFVIVIKSLTHYSENYYADAVNRKKIFDKFAKSRGFDPLVAENWYSITSEDILPFRVCYHNTSM